MQNATRSGIRGALVAAVILLLGAGPAHADATRCQEALIDGSAAFVRAKAKALQKCEDKVIRGKLPAGTDCSNEARVVVALAKASAKFGRRVGVACGGDDRTCGTGDDPPLSEVGWTAAACPNLRNASCTSAINHCGDVQLCLECIGDSAVDQALAPAVDSLVTTDPRTERELNRCQSSHGKLSAGLLAAEAKALGDCWSRRNQGDPVADCADAEAQEAIDRAALKKAAALCRACGGDDRVCGGGDDLTPAQVGFPASCPALGTCAGAVSELGGALLCLDCLADFAADCAARAAVPQFAAYPDACKPAVAPPQLNFSLPPVFGSTALSSGFVPDPFTVGLTAGGPVNVNYLGGGCTGFATSAPSFSVNYTAGAFPTLRFYFIGSADTTMIINSPSGSFFCVDDSFGTLNPTLDFNSPSSGRYDVWIGTFASGGSTGGTLFVTENTGNHP